MTPAISPDASPRRSWPGWFSAVAGGLFLVTTLPGSTLAQSPSGPARAIIEHFHMERIPQEGPWFSVAYVGSEKIDGAALPPRYRGQAHATGSAILAVETAADFSALHRLQTDETWHFYGGNPLELLLLHPDGHGETVLLGADFARGELPQFTVPRGVWQGSAPVNGVGAEAYAFFGCQLAPGFEYADFEIGYRDELQRAYPKFADRIGKLTRAEFVVRP